MTIRSRRPFRFCFSRAIIIALIGLLAFGKNKMFIGDLSGSCSRRINRQHRLVYQIIDDERTVKVIRMWTHYESAEIANHMK